MTLTTLAKNTTIDDYDRGNSLSSGISRRRDADPWRDSCVMWGRTGNFANGKGNLGKGGRVMTVRLKLDGVIGFVLLILITSMVMAAPVFAKDMPAWEGSGGARPVDKDGSPRSSSKTADFFLAPGEGVIGAFAATPTSGNIQGAILAGRNTFSTAETIEFNGLLFKTGMAGTSVEFWVYLFDTRGQLLTFGYGFDNGISSDRTAFYLRMNAGTPPGFYKWLMEFHDDFGNYFITPIQTFEVVGAF